MNSMMADMALSVVEIIGFGVWADNRPSHITDDL
jgi:hypothetical protein